MIRTVVLLSLKNFVHVLDRTGRSGMTCRTGRKDRTDKKERTGRTNRTYHAGQAANQDMHKHDKQD